MSWRVCLAWMLVVALGGLGACTESGSGAPDLVFDGAGDGGADGLDQPTWEYGVPLDPRAPWPRFRRDEAQTGQAPFAPADGGGPLLTFATAGGIFSSPVIDGDGVVYLGSADWNFYALRADGTEKWRFKTNGVIDSAALLDDQGRLYFGSGDGYLYALDRDDGRQIWRFQAEPPEGAEAFINWFEGNVAMLPDGTLLAGNDNFHFYGVDREGGAQLWDLRLPDQTWSSAAVDVAGQRLFFGNNNLVTLLGPNTYALDFAGKKLWGKATGATIAASPLLHPAGVLVLGGFDGTLLARQLDDGAEVWRFEARDHLYASPALGAEDSIIQPSADGSVYCLDSGGKLRWTFDWGAPLRSSPAVDSLGRIYLGTGDGHLLVLNADGTLRFALRLIAGDRDDLNASPALGLDRVVLAGESGEVFQVPADFCLRPEEASNPACTLGPAEPLAAQLVALQYVSPFGNALPVPPSQVDPVQPVTLALTVRQEGDTVLALLDAASLQVTVDPPVAFDVTVSANQTFLVVQPQGRFATREDGGFQVRVQGDYLVNPQRSGLVFSGGTVGGSFDQTFDFGTPAAPNNPFSPEIPSGPGGQGTVLALTRLAAPLPSLLPSYNQIGFDNLAFLVSFVEGAGGDFVAFVVEALPSASGALVPVPATKGVFPVRARVFGDSLVLESSGGPAVEMMAVSMRFDSFRIAGSLGQSAAQPGVGVVTASLDCGALEFYGQFLRKMGLCNPTTDRMLAFGAILQFAHAAGAAPDCSATATFKLEGTLLTLTPGTALGGAGRVFSLLLLDAATGAPLALDYGAATQVSLDGLRNLDTLTLDLSGLELPAKLRAHFLVDGLPAATATLDVGR